MAEVSIFPEQWVTNIFYSSLEKPWEINRNQGLERLQN